MKHKNKAKPASGFEEGRSAVRGASSSKKKSKSGATKLERKQEKLNKAKNDLADVLSELAGHDVPEPGGMVGSDGIEKASAKFERDFRRIRKSIIKEDGGFNADSASRALLKSMFATNLALVPIAEQAYRNSKKETAMYALLGLQKQTQELAAELKMLGNIEHQSDFIRTKICKPLFVAMIQNLLNEMISLKNTVDTEVSSKKASRPIKLAMDEATKQLGAFIDHSSEKLVDDITAYLSGDMRIFEPETSSKKKRKSRSSRSE